MAKNADEPWKVVVGIAFLAFLFFGMVGEQAKKKKPREDYTIKTGAESGSMDIGGGKGSQEKTPKLGELPRRRAARRDITDGIWKVGSSKKGTSGTAFLVGVASDGKAILVSNHHVIEGADDLKLGGGLDGVYSIFDGVEVVVTDEELDLALLSVEDLDVVFPIRVNVFCNGERDEIVKIVGYGKGKFLQRNTKLTYKINNLTLNMRDGLSKSRDTLVWGTEDHLLPGHSGSPCVDRYDRLVGVAFASSDERGYIVPSHYVRRMLREAGLGHLIETQPPAEKPIL